MRFHTTRNEEPADAREALLMKYYSSKNNKSSSTIQDYRNANSQSLRSHSGRSSQPFHSISTAPSPSQSPPSLVFSPTTSRSVSPFSPDLNFYAENPAGSSRAHEEEEDLSSDAYVHEYQRANYKQIKLYEQLSLYGSRAPRFQEGGFHIPLALDERRVESVLQYWDKGLGYVPEGDIYSGIRAFEAGAAIDVMELNSCAALVHILAEAIKEGRLPREYATPEQIKHYLSFLHESVKRRPGYPTTPFKKEHWLLGTARDRDREIRWLGEQAEGLFWSRHNELVRMNYQRSQEPSDWELANIFDAYVRA